jgi:hypothetical protein
MTEKYNNDIDLYDKFIKNIITLIKTIIRNNETNNILKIIDEKLKEESINNVDNSLEKMMYELEELYKLSPYNKKIFIITNIKKYKDKMYKQLNLLYNDSNIKFSEEEYSKIKRNIDAIIELTEL